MSVTIVLCYARSGGTLLNRALNNLDNVVVLSEVNPLNEISDRAIINPITTVAVQAKEWFDVNLKSALFSEQILEMEQWCKEHDKHLIIRDWTFIDFTAHSLNKFSPPGYSSTIDVLKNKIDIKKFAFIRDSIDVYLSRGTSLNEFCNSYINYANYLVDHKIDLFRYEDLCVNPLNEFKRICKFLDLSLPLRSNLFCSQSKYTGDVKPSRGNRCNKPKELKRRYVSLSHRKKINECKLMKESNFLLGYPIKYESRKAECFFEFIFSKIERKFRNVFRV